jgi:bacterioferritin (cytochrome b1)
MEKLAARNPNLILDLLSGRLAFERTSVKLYDNVIQKIERSADPRYQPLLGELRKIRNEEWAHEEWLEAQIRSLGGTAHETTEMSQLETEEAMGVRNVIVDGHQKVLHLVHALLAAELSDNAGWDLLVKLANDSGDREAKFAFMKRQLEEVKHLAFLREVVARATENEILGFEEKMPSSFGEVAMNKIGRRSLAALLLGAGTAMAVALFRRFRIVKGYRLRFERGGLPFIGAFTGHKLFGGGPLTGRKLFGARLTRGKIRRALHA